MQINQVEFSIAAHAAWAPNATTPQQWADWARAPHVFAGDDEPKLPLMPPMLRRRAGFLGKMALQVAYQCLEQQGAEQLHTIPSIFCSRHGDVSRSMELLGNLVQDEPLSPTTFGLAVHNASAGLFSIARKDSANHIALAAGSSTIEHGVIDACGLLADGAASVLLVAADAHLPALFASYADCDEQPHAWAWLMVPAAKDVLQLRWQARTEPLAAATSEASELMPASLQVAQFYWSNSPSLERHEQLRSWSWSRHAR